MPVRSDPDNPLYLREVCFTGILANMTRDQANEHVRRCGGFPSKTVRYGTILVCGVRTGKVKMDAATDKGATCWSEEKFLQAIGWKSTVDIPQSTARDDLGKGKVVKPGKVEDLRPRRNIELD